MKVQRSKSTGEYRVDLGDGNFIPARVQRNKSTGEMRVMAGGKTFPYSGGASVGGAGIGGQQGQEPRTYADRVSVGTRGVLQGLGSIGDAVFTGPMNGINGLLGGDPNYFKPMGAVVSDAIGLEKPATSDERFFNAMFEGVAGVLPTFGAGVAMQAGRGAANIAPAAIKELPKYSGVGKSVVNAPAKTIDALRQFGLLGNQSVRQAVGPVLTDLPSLQFLSGASGGAAMGEAQEAGAGVGGQMLAGIFGGGAPGLGAMGANIGARIGRSGVGFADRLTKSGQARTAGTLIEDFATDAAKARQLAGEGGGVLVEGSTPTTAQLTGDTGLAVLEKAMASGPGGDQIKNRYIDQQNAQREALDSLLNPISERQAAQALEPAENLRSFAPNRAMSEERALGETVKDAFDRQYGAMKKRVGQAYDAIDPNGTTRFNLEPLLQGFDEFITSGGRFQKVPGEIKSLLADMDDAVKNGVNVSYRDLQGARTILGDLVQSAGETGNATVKRMATELRKQLDDYINRGGMADGLQGSSPTPAPGSNTYREATGQARQLVNQDPHFEMLDYLAQNGLSRESLEAAIGPEGVRELNARVPNLVRKGGKLQYDDVATEFGYRDGGELIEGLQSRFNGDNARKMETMRGHRADDFANRAEGHTGFTYEQADQLRRAQLLRKQQGDQFEQGANRPLTRFGNALEGGAVDASSIPGMYFKPSKRGGSEAMEALARRALGDKSDVPFGDPLPFYGEPDAASAMREYAVQQALREAVGKGDILDAGKLNRFMEVFGPALRQMGDEGLGTALNDASRLASDSLISRQALQRVAKPDVAGHWGLNQKNRQFPELPSGSGFTPDEAAGLFKSQQDLKRVMDTHDRAKVQGSPTAQLLLAQDEIEGIKLGTSRNGFWGILADKATNHSSKTIESELLKALLDPEHAARLLANTNNMRGWGIDGVRRWSGRASTPIMDVMRRYGIRTSLDIARDAAQAKEKR